MKTIRVYLINLNNYDVDVHGEVPHLSDEQFIDFAEKEGTIYSLEGFQSAVNNDEVSMDYSFIRILDTEQKSESKRAQLMDTELWKTRMCFTDVYECMTPIQRNYIDALTDEQLEAFIEKNHSPMQKGFEGGMMSDWATVASTIASDLEY